MKRENGVALGVLGTGEGMRQGSTAGDEGWVCGFVGSLKGGVVASRSNAELSKKAEWCETLVKDGVTVERATSSRTRITSQATE